MNVLNKTEFCILQFFFFVFYLPICSAQLSPDYDSFVRGDIRIMFYNVENFFDTKDDSIYNDNEFLPESEKGWTDFRYHRKAVNIFKTIAAVGGERPPEIICLAEVENAAGLKELCLNTPLSKYNYGIVHYDSPDSRGIDVALIYEKSKISELASNNFQIVFPPEIAGTTRDVLYFKALVNTLDTLHIFVNHWPSRRGGKNRTESKRVNLARLLRSKIDSILSIDSCANIIATGDFNDEPSDRSLEDVLEAKLPENTMYCGILYNLSAELQNNCKCGTYKYRGGWTMLDQFIVSGSMLNNRASISACLNCIHIGDYNFLLLEDEKYGGWKPDRTYLGPVYKGGFSDHLPIYLDLYY